MLARLVVHLQANYRSLTAGLRASRNETADTAQAIRRSVAGIGDGGTVLEDFEGSVSDISEQWQYVNKGIRTGVSDLEKLSEEAKRAAAATEAIIIKSSTNRVAAPAPAPSKTSALINVASTALGVRAVSQLSGALTVAKRTIVDVASSTRSTVSVLDRFRLGLSAPKVDPSLNTLPGIIANITRRAASGVETLRGFGDATISGIPAILASVAGGMKSLMGAGDNLQATVSKITSGFELKKQALDRVAKIYPTAGTAVSALKSAMDFIAPAAERVAQSVDHSNDVLREGTIWTRNFAYLATGSFAKTGTSADLYARGMYHALLPTRLMMFEAKFAQGSLTLMRRAYVTLTHPIHAVSMAFAKGRGELRELRANLPPLTGGLQLGTRAFRAFAHSTYFAATAGRGIAAVVSPVTFLGRKLWGLVQPAKAAKVGLDGVATGGQKAGIVLRGVSTVASSAGAALRKVGSVGGTGFASGITRGAGAAKLAIAGVMTAMVVMGTQTAIATEKNNAVFGTMLHDMSQGAAVVKSIQGTKAARLFDNQELLDSSRLLFKAGVNTVDLAKRTDQFAKIATATSTDLGDLTRIYQQGANAGSFGQDKINQYAERGIAIYEGLTAATGLSGAALQKMISDGKIGVTEMDAALAHLTEGHGVYADSLTNMANTTAGKLATMKNNVSQSLGQVMGIALEIIAPLMTAVVSITEGAKSAFESFRGPIMYAATAVAWFFSNLGSLAQFAFVALSLAAVSTFNDLVYWLTDVMPAYLTWFADNWMNIFTDILNGTATIFSNLVTNVSSAMSEIWKFIKSGGTEGLEFTWTPLLDGFKATVEALPEIAQRPMSELEKSLSSQMETLGSSLADDFDNSFAQAVATTQPTVEIKPATTGGQSGQGDVAQKDGSATEKAKQAENKAVLVRSEEGQKVLADMLRRGLNSDKKTAEQLAKDSRDYLQTIARNTGAGSGLRKRAFGGGS